MFLQAMHSSNPVGSQTKIVLVLVLNGAVRCLLQRRSGMGQNCLQSCTVVVAFSMRDVSKGF